MADQVKLTPKQEAFVREYLVDLNATQAAIRAGYKQKTAHVVGFENIRKPKVAERIQELMDERSEKTELTAERVLEEIKRLAFIDITEAAQHTIQGPGDLASLPEDVRRAITGWSWDREGRIVLKFADKKSALELLGKHLKLFTDKHELTGKDGEPIQMALTDRIIEARKRAEGGSE